MSKLFERVVKLEAQAKAAHDRIDKTEVLIHQDLKDIKDNFKEMSKELKDVIAWMNRGKGWAAAALLIASLVGGIVAKVLVK